MPRAPPAKPRRSAAAPSKKVTAAGPRPAAAVKVAIPVPPSPPPRGRIEEPVWLVRAVLVLFLVGFAAFLAREVYSFVQALG